MDGRAEVVEKAGQGELERARGAAWLGFGFEDVYASGGLREGDGGGKAVGSGADYGGLSD
jgi:hypothetical protein